MNVAYVVSMFPCWSETFILNEIVDHASAGVDVTILSIRPFTERMIQPDARAFLPRVNYPPAAFSPRLAWLHVRLLLKHPVRYWSLLGKVLAAAPPWSMVGLKSLFVFWLTPAFIGAVIEEHVQHMHAHFATYPALLARLLSSFTGVPYSFTAHAHDIYVDRSLLPLVSENAETIVTISDFNRRLIERSLGGAPHGPVQVVRCGLDLRRFVFDEARPALSSHAGTLCILSVGRLSGIKGFRFLLDAVAMLRDWGIRSTCRIIGDGPERDALHLQASRLGLAESVAFLGARTSDEVRAELRGADLLVIACATDPLEGHDGIPVVFMEAMALGTPVVGTRLSGVPELIVHGSTGLLAEPGDARSLAEAIRFAVAHPGEVEAMRQEARRAVEREFDVAANAARLRMIFSC
jgi:colanic acid/amylovoran biosynthesis glycosyltransferase